MAFGKELLYIIRARDDASKEIRKVKSSFDDANASAQQSGRTMGLLGSILTREVGQDMRDFGLSVLSAFGTFEEAGRGAIRETKALDAVLRSTGGAAGLTAGEIQGMAAALQQVTNFQDETILSGQNVLLTFTKIGREVFPQASETALNLATALKTDVASAARQLGKALQDPVEGLDALSRVGVRFTDEQKALIEAMVAAGDTAGAQRLILGQLEVQFGGLARATSDSRTQMTNAIDDIKESIGKTLVPAFDRAAEALLPVIRNVSAWIEKHPELVQTIGVVVVAVGGLLTVLGTLVIALASVTAALGVLGITLAAGGAVVLALTGLIALVATLTQHWEGLKWMVGNAITAITANVRAWVEDFRNLFILLGTYIRDALTGALEAVRAQFEAFFEWVASRIKSLAAQATKTALGAVVPGGGATVDAVRAVTGRAGGGHVREPLTLVGEEGPELVSLPRGSYVHTAGETRAMMGGGAPVVIQGSLLGEVHVHNEADEDRLAEKVTAHLARLIRLQQMTSA